MTDFGSLRCRMKILILLLNVKEINRKEGRRVFPSLLLFLHFHRFVRSTMAPSLLGGQWDVSADTGL